MPTRTLLIGITLAVAFGSAAYFALFSVNYQGRRIWLTYPLLDLDSFKNASSNISDHQARRVARVMLAAPIESHYRSAAEAIEAVGALQFPGYGSSVVPVAGPDGQKHALLSELPRLGEDRCLLFHDRSQFVLVDDFVASGLITAVAISQAGATYNAYDGRPVAVTPTPARLNELRL